MGRTNVGKSTLLNAIVNANERHYLGLAYASPKRGLTNTMNFYGIGPGNGVTLKKEKYHTEIVGPGGFVIVDMPGYGERASSSWSTEITKYIDNRTQLRRVFVLVDAEVGMTERDLALLALLRLAGVSHQVIITKVDKIYLPLARKIARSDHQYVARLRPKGTLGNLRDVMVNIRESIQPRDGEGAVGEILACSGDVLVHGRPFGVDFVRFAVLRAVGLAPRTKVRKRPAEK